jgi:DNA polymerase-3 subunit alpha
VGNIGSISKRLFKKTGIKGRKQMDFKKYSSIENSYRQKTIQSIFEYGFQNHEWVVSEKIHGCLDYNTIIITNEYGPKKLGDIVNQKLPCHVLTYNIEKNKEEWKRINTFSETPKGSKQWYRITLKDGKKIQITGNHYVWLPKHNCYRKVEDLVEGDEILLKK